MPVWKDKFVSELLFFYRPIVGSNVQSDGIGRFRFVLFICNASKTALTIEFFADSIVATTCHTMVVF